MKPRRLVILAQFDPDNALPAHVRLHLERLRKDADKLVLVSNSPIDERGLEIARRLCDSVIERENIGWDFAGWRDALAAEDMADYDEIVLTNSSVIGPLFDLAPIFAEMAARPCAFWGMVYSRQKGPHLQSYFLCFEASVFRSAAWAAFWRTVRDIRDKETVILRYEVGLTRHLTDAGFRVDSYIPSPRFPGSIRLLYSRRLGRFPAPWSVNRVNRTIHRYFELILDGMPYLKASLLWGKDTHRFRHRDALKRLRTTDYPWHEIGL